MEGRIVGGNIGGRVFLDGAVERGNPNSADEAKAIGLNQLFLLPRGEGGEGTTPDEGFLPPGRATGRRPLLEPQGAK